MVELWYVSDVEFIIIEWWAWSLLLHGESLYGLNRQRELFGEQAGDKDEMEDKGDDSTCADIVDIDIDVVERDIYSCFFYENKNL